VAPLRTLAEIAGVHVLDHALAQRAYRTCGHWKPSWLRLMTTSICQDGPLARYQCRLNWLPRPPVSRVRLHSELSRSDLVRRPVAMV
jgi:hypothetical protein